ncbi:MAG: DUF668 domain-containing protein [Flavobacteriales bacterium]|nr:DUF668 domain-containing protein [Flavobacteriales bacterium]
MTKLDLKQAAIAKQVFNTTNEEVLDQVKAVLESQNDAWFQNLPAKVRKEIEESLAQADRGETVSHQQAMKLVRAWQKR